LPETANTLAHKASRPMASTGTRVLLLNCPIFEKKSPSRAIANGTRAFTKITPCKAPMVEIRKAAVTNFVPEALRKVCAALVAKGRALRYTVELDVTTSLNGRAYR